MFPQPHFDALVTALHSPDWQAQKKAVLALGTLDDRRALPVLLEALQHQNHWVRETAAETLGTLDRQGVLEALTQSTEDQNRWVRLSALEALGRLADERAIPLLIAHLDEADRAMRTAAVNALCEIGPTTAEALVSVLLQGDLLAQRSAAEALGRLQQESAIEPLLTVLIQRSDPTLRRIVVDALRQFRTIPGLLMILQDKPPALRQLVSRIIDVLDRQANSLQPQVLVAEAIHDEREMLALTLQLDGLRSMVVDDGRLVLQAIRQSDPDLLLLAARLPGLDGFEVCTRLRQNQDLRHLPVIMVSTDSQAEAIARSHKVGVDAYLVKPYSPADLLRQVHAILSTPMPARR